MVVILFRSRLTSAAGADYVALDAELSELVKAQDGFLDVKSYSAADGERLTIVWWRDQESLAKWKALPRHAEAQRAGRQHWYQYYKMEVAEVVRESHFARPESANA
jgi:heme-degrading monooxygenase HmoA